MKAAISPVEIAGGFRVEVRLEPAIKYLPRGVRLPLMAALSPLPGILVGLVALALVILVGRFVLKVAWKLVVLATLVVAVLWILGLVGL